MISWGEFRAKIGIFMLFEKAVSLRQFFIICLLRKEEGHARRYLTNPDSDSELVILPSSELNSLIQNSPTHQLSRRWEIVIPPGSYRDRNANKPE